MLYSSVAVLTEVLSVCGRVWPRAKVITVIVLHWVVIMCILRAKLSAVCAHSWRHGPVTRPGVPVAAGITLKRVVLCAVRDAGQRGVHLRRRL